MKYLLAVLTILLLLSGCSSDIPEPPQTELPPPQTSQTLPPETLPADPIERMMRSMTLEEQVGQLFLVRCNGETALEDIANYHLGGLVLFGVDFEQETPESVTQTIAAYQEAAKVPLLIALDEEGGTVTRVSHYSQFRETPFDAPRDLYDRGGMDLVLDTETEKCQLLRSLGINVNLAPVCDISTQPDALLYRRSLGQGPETTSSFISNTVRIMADHQIGSVLKHFPGYGDNEDTHVQIAIDSRSLETYESSDLLPFHAGIDSGADAVMVCHTIVEAMDSEMPASLSPAVHRYLRENMGHDGVVMTDDLVMEAITQQYGAGEAAVLAVLAGNDLLCSTEYAVQYEAVLEAVLTGRIDYGMIVDSVKRVLRWKQELGLI